jgi:hypothetical protein
MLNSGKIKFALRATTKVNILILVLSEKKILNETKNHSPPPLQVNWSVPKKFVDRCLPFVLFALAMVLSVLLRFTASYYLFGIFKLKSLLEHVNQRV